MSTTTSANIFEAAEIERLIGALTARGADLRAKTSEYSKRCDSASLIAELRTALAVSTWTGGVPTFDVGDEPDLRFLGINGGFSVEVVHGSSTNGFRKVFYPAPQSVSAKGAASRDWELAAAELQDALKTLPVTITPWVDDVLQDHHFSFGARLGQEQLAAEVARWLIAQLRTLEPNVPVQLRHENARFDIEWLTEGPGRIHGHGPLSATYLRVSGSPGDRDTMNSWLETKLVEKAKAIERRAPQEVSLVGLVIDDAYALAVGALANRYFGGLVTSHGGSRPASYRPVPSSQFASLDALRALREQAIEPLCLHPVDDESHRPLYGCFFDPRLADIDGIIALYYTGALQFLPNPLARRPIERLFAHLPPRSKATDHPSAASWSART